MERTLADYIVCDFAKLQLAKENSLKLNTVRHFVLDECDKMLEKLGEYFFGINTAAMLV